MSATPVRRLLEVVSKHLPIRSALKLVLITILCSIQGNAAASSTAHSTGLAEYLPFPRLTDLQTWEHAGTELRQSQRCDCSRVVHQQVSFVVAEAFADKVTALLDRFRSINPAGAASAHAHLCPLFAACLAPDA